VPGTCSITGYQCAEMDPHSQLGQHFLGWLASHDSLSVPTGPGGAATDVTEIGSIPDQIVTPAAYSVSLPAPHKLLYSTPPNYGHIINQSTDDVSGAFDVLGWYVDNGRSQIWTQAPHGVFEILLATGRLDW